MRKLLLTLALGLFLSFPLVSHAGVNVFGVETPVVKKEVSDKLAGGSYIASEHLLTSTLVPQKLKDGNSAPSNIERKETFYVFGVDINSLNLI